MKAVAKYEDSSKPEIENAMRNSEIAFRLYRKCSLKQRADFMRAIGVELENIRSVVIPVTKEETHLPETRLNGELGRTIFQMNSYADAVEEGSWIEARIDTAQPERKPNAKPDLRKTSVPLGPVVIFGSSNFPFAFSTAGGDTACALAAGCSVVVKAHPGHPRTSGIVAEAILKAVKKCKMPEGIFTHLYGSSFEVGKELVLHPLTKAVGFTGSLMGGRALFDLANQRKNPIPVFAEMGSINPVFLLPDKLKSDSGNIAKIYAASITQGTGQFCTQPGLIIGVEGKNMDKFISLLSVEIGKSEPAEMLHAGIAAAFWEKRKTALAQKGVDLETDSNAKEDKTKGEPTLASTSGETFLKNPVLHNEVFGPYSLIIKCKSVEEMEKVALCIEGQLTCTLMATDKDMNEHAGMVEYVQQICGRLIMNGVPTGVEVCRAMHHGGPYPATTDSRFTSVGSDGIKRFIRPVCFQDFPDYLLPPELKNDNPLKIWRTVNNVLTKDIVE